MAQQSNNYDMYDLTASPHDEKTSLLYSVLPKIVRARIKRILLMRRSMSHYALGSEQSSTSTSRRASGLSSNLETPPPGYRSRISFSEPVSDNEGDDDLPPTAVTRLFFRRSCPNDSSIIWEFANQGLSNRKSTSSRGY
jgi:hypothetical protein